MAPAEIAATTTKVEAAGRMPPMEWEPRTLTFDQIKYAREAALYVVSTKTEEEAIRIFTEGLKPVQMTVRKCSMDSSSDDDVDLHSSGYSSSRCGGGSKGRGHRERRSVERDIATAPF
ncbi:uncharacterized protein LOC133905200 [Phragmites australis]|uniref:uncharacterized protein LOC133905200 n=1 Tax=Phragmites australis TaxID=29695 RepID=UPI002D787BBF|nr:uncharacterized protein LOC133905200 [Phragmites australis]